MVKLIENASKDPKVLAIKQTLYRVSGESPIVKSLGQAAENGKQVTVLVELKARFDEENNIQWARRLEKSGCHVIYGLVGLKTHSKITLIVRNEEDGIRRYVHLGTGNYNDITAKLYTDMGLLTCDNYIGADASAVFNSLSGYTDVPKLNKIVMAPTMLRNKFVELIRRESEYAIKGKKSKIIAKMNSLIDTDIINEIDLIVRGICGLKPKIEGISENITVRSIVGRFLEHSRIYYFYNNGSEEIFLSSADLMPRNLDRRVELLFPIEDKDIKERIKNYFNIIYKDNAKTRFMDSDGNYGKKKLDSVKMFNSQEYLCQLAKERASMHRRTHRKKFIPREKPSN
jgi:polyphosphate kinase